MFCSKCGTKNTDDSNFCIECGSSLSGISLIDNSRQASTNTLPDLNEASNQIILTPDFINSNEFDSLFGGKSNYYKAPFLRIYELNNSGQTTTISQRVTASGYNWSAGLLGYIWFGFRGVHKVAIKWVIIETIMFGVNSSPLMTIIKFAVIIVVLGFTANIELYNSLNFKLSEAKRNNQSNSTIELANPIMGIGYLILGAVLSFFYMELVLALDRMFS
jgi:hypothetical protein